MSGTLFRTRYPGVFYKEVRSRSGEKDKLYVVNIPGADGRRHWKNVGAHSDGTRPDTAAAIRMHIVAEIDRMRKNGAALLPCESARKKSPDAVVCPVQRGARGSSATASGTEDAAMHSVATVGNVRIEIIKETPARTRAYTIGDAIEAYCAWAKENGKSADRYMAQYNRHCRKLVHNHPIDGFTPTQAEKLKASLFRSGLSAQSVHHVLAFLRRACNQAVGQEKAVKNPFVAVKGGIFSMPKLDNARTRYLTPDEARALLAELKRRSNEMFMMAFVALHTGMRAPEIFRLRREDVDASAGVIHVHAKMSGADEVVYAPPSVVEMLLDIPVADPHDLLFPARGGGLRTATPDTFERAVVALGIQSPKGSRKRITFHTLRHTFASWLAQSGEVTLQELEALMRHHSLAMTMRYAHLIPSATARKIGLIGATLLAPEKG